MPQRIFFGTGVAQQLRALDQKTAMRILIALTTLLETGDGDTKSLHGYDPPQMRLRVGDYRVRYRYVDGTLQVIAVGHRRDVYR